MKVLWPLRTYPSFSRIAVVRIAARSLPVDGSVIATAVISSPVAQRGSQRLLLLVRAEGVQVRHHDVRVQAERDAARARASELLGDDRRMQEIPARTTPLLAEPAAEKPLLTGAPPELARDDVVLFPLLVKGDDFSLYPGANVLAEQVVFFTK